MKKSVNSDNSFGDLSTVSRFLYLYFTSPCIFSFIPNLDKEISNTTKKSLIQYGAVVPMLSAYLSTNNSVIIFYLFIGNTKKVSFTFLRVFNIK